MSTGVATSVHGTGGAQCDPGIERDLYAAAGELGEVAGWLLYDTGERDLMRRVNHEAPHLSRLAGDHSMALLILQHMSMHAGHLGRPWSAEHRDDGGLADVQVGRRAADLDIGIRRGRTDRGS
jgi:hypothetical protein